MAPRVVGWRRHAVGLGRDDGRVDVGVVQRVGDGAHDVGVVCVWELGAQGVKVGARDELEAVRSGWGRGAEGVHKGFADGAEGLQPVQELGASGRLRERGVHVGVGAQGCDGVELEVRLGQEA